MNTSGIEMCGAINGLPAGSNPTAKFWHGNPQQSEMNGGYPSSNHLLHM